MNSSPDIYELQSETSDYWKKFKKGDQSAFEQLYRNHFSELFRYGMTLLPNEPIVKDSIQQLFLDLWKYKATICEAENPTFYLIKCLRNSIIRYIRESKRYSCVNSSKFADYESLPSRETLIIQSDDDEKQKKELKLLINDLPPRQREAIMLIFFEQLSYEEVSSLLSMSVQSVYTLVWRSVAALRKKCK